MSVELASSLAIVLLLIVIIKQLDALIHATQKQRLDLLTATREVRETVSDFNLDVMTKGENE